MKTINLLLVMLFSIAVAACGGGGSSGSGSNGSGSAVSGGGGTTPAPAPTYSISGTVSYVGAKTGTIYIRVIPCDGCSSVLGAVADSSGAYTARGLQPGTYTVVAEMDALGTTIPTATAIPNATNPSGSSPVTISAANPNPSVNVTVADPSSVTPGTPVLLRVAPGNGSAFVMYSPPEDIYGREYATSYNIYWSTDSTVPTGGGSATFAAQGDRTNFHVLSGLPDGGKLYFRMTALVGTTESTSPSNIIGPVTIGATAGPNTLNTVDGSVTFPPGAAAGAMIVGLYGNATGSSTPTVYFTRIPSPVSPQSYSIGGVPDGSYFPFAVIDNNGNGAIDIGDLSNIRNSINGLGGLVTVAGSITGNDISLSPVSATASVNTEHYWDGGLHSYRLILGVNDGSKRAVAATLLSGPNVAVPLDISANRVISLDTIRPNTGDSYMFKVTFSDGTTENISGSVTGVLDSFATNLATVTNGTSGSTPTVPLFTWAAPATPPASYIYRLILWGDADKTDWRYPQYFGLPSTTLSALYNADGRAYRPGLSPGQAPLLQTGMSYNWAVQVRDGNGNSASSQATYMY